MKNLLFAGLLLAAGLFSNAQYNSKKGTFNASADWAFKPTYSASVKFGNPAYAQGVLQAWKDFERGVVEDANNTVEDTFLFINYEGKIFQGKENALKVIREARNNMNSLQLEVGGILPMEFMDRKPGEQMVAIWGNERFTLKDGSQHSMGLHEIWFFNPNGKLAAMIQYAYKQQ